MDGTIISIVVPLLLFFVLVAIVLYLSVRSSTSTSAWSSSGSARRARTSSRSPGLRFLIPVVDRPVKVDVREDFDEIPSQTNITKDNAPIDIDFLIYFRIVDPLASVVNIYDFRAALRGIATTTLRAVIGDMNLDDVLSKRDQINDVLRAAPRRADRALGRQGHHGRDPRAHPAARRPGLDEPHADRGARRGAPSSPSPRARASRRSTSPRATSSPTSCARRASGRPPSCRPRATARPSSASSRPPARSTTAPWRCSTSRRSSSWAPRRPRSTSSRWSSRTSPSASGNFLDSGLERARPCAGRAGSRTVASEPAAPPAVEERNAAASTEPRSAGRHLSRRLSADRRSKAEPDRLAASADSG